MCAAPKNISPTRESGHADIPLSSGQPLSASPAAERQYGASMGNGMNRPYAFEEAIMNVIAEGGPWTLILSRETLKKEQTLAAFGDIAKFHKKREYLERFWYPAVMSIATNFANFQRLSGVS